MSQSRSARPLGSSTRFWSAAFPATAPPQRITLPSWEHFQCHAGACRRFGAASLDLAMVARGWLDGYWESRLQPWDVSAGALLVEEAGGTVTSITGSEFASASGNAVASNGAIHKEILAGLATVGEILAAPGQ